MATTSSVYDWAGGRQKPPSRPECSRAVHAKLIEACGKMMSDTRVKAYAYYRKECVAWGRQPMDEARWFQDANAACARNLRKQKEAEWKRGRSVTSSNNSITSGS